MMSLISGLAKIFEFLHSTLCFLSTLSMLAKLVLLPLVLLLLLILPLFSLLRDRRLNCFEDDDTSADIFLEGKRDFD